MEKQNWTDKLFNIVTLAGTAILMNLMFLIASLPIVTIGPAWCGLMSSVRYNVRGEGWFKGFKTGFCTRFWRSLIIWCICLPLCLFFLNDFRIAVNVVEGTAVVQTQVTDADATAATEATEVTGSDDETEIQIETGPTVPNIVNCVISGLFFALAAMVTISLLTLNVYIPTSVSNWIKNGVNFFRHPLELFGAAGLFWAPLLLFIFFPEWFIFAIMIFIAAYYALAAVCGTMVLKEPLIGFLIDARADGTLTAEEGSAPIRVEED